MTGVRVRVGAWVAATTLVLAGCGGADGEGAAAAAGAAATAGGLGEASEVLTVACSDEGIEVEGRRVIAGPDGVHLDVRSLPADGTTVELASVSAGGVGKQAGSLGGAHEVGSRVIDTVTPGQVLVRCYPDHGPRHFQSAEQDPESLPIQVVGPDANWAPIPDLDCSGPVAHVIYDHAAAPSEVGETVHPLVDTAAADLGQSRDDIEIFGFGDGRRRWAGVRKEGVFVTVASYVADGEGWRITGATSCDSS